MVQLFCSKFPNQQSVNNQYLSTVLLRKGNSSDFTRESRMSSHSPEKFVFHGVDFLDEKLSYMTVLGNNMFHFSYQ